MWISAVLLAAFAVPGGRGGQEPAPVGFISKGRIVELAKAADASIASFSPAPDALASYVALVDPVHIRMFVCAARPADLKIAAAIGQTVEAAANPALTVEFVAVTEDLAEPKAVIAENSVTKTPEIIVYWMGSEIVRLHPEPGAAVETELAEQIFQARTQIAEANVLDHDFFKYTFHKDLTTLDCKRCHGPGFLVR